MFDWIIQTSLRNRLLTVVAYVVVLVVGILVLRKVTLDVFPEFAPPQVVIQTEAPGLAPEDVERLITFPMETALNGIILVSHYRQLRAEGRSREEVVVEGSKDRLAPVLMTAAAAALGVLPLVLGEPPGKELERPMAYVILGGLFTSTILNMIVVPAVFAKFGWEREEVFERQQEARETVFLTKDLPEHSEKR